MTTSKKTNYNKTLLSVDWDFFFPIPEHDPHMLYDWGQREDMKLFFDMIWIIRASAFYSNGLPLPGSSGEETNFWKKFKFSPTAKLYYAESHTTIWSTQVRHSIRKVVNYDAHHDGWGLKGNIRTVDCGNWATHFYLCGKKIKTVFPRWSDYMLKYQKPLLDLEMVIDDSKPVDTIFDRIFVCRSGAWTPTWLDKKFLEFIDSCPVKEKILIHYLIPRAWNRQSIKQAKKMAADTEMLMRKNTELIEGGRVK